MTSNEQDQWEASIKAPSTDIKPVRGRGRPKRGNPESGPNHLVETAQRLLRNRRIASLTHTEVANAAGVDEKLVRYYFDKYEKLIDAVIDLEINNLNDVMADASARSGNATEMLRHRFGALLDFSIATPNFYKLLVDRVFDGTDPSASEKLDKITLEAYDRHLRFVTQGREEGRIRDDFDPRLLYLAIVGLAEIFVTANPVLTLLIGEKPDLRHEYQEFVIRLIMDGIGTR